MISKCTLLLVAAALAVAGPGCVRDTAMNGRVAAAQAGTMPLPEAAPGHRPWQAKSAEQPGRNYAEVDGDLQTGVLAGILRYVRRAGCPRRSVQPQADAARAERAVAGVVAESAAQGLAASQVRYEPATGVGPAHETSINGLNPGRGGRNYTPLDPLDRNS